MTTPNPQTSSPGAAARPGFDRTLLAVLIVVIVVAGVAIVLVTAFFLGPSLQVTTKSFTPYSTPVSKDTNNPSSLTIVNTNGEINISPWFQDYLLINGTVTARGIGADTNAITFAESNSSGDIVFQAIFPPGTAFSFSTGYTVNINVYTPESVQFKTVQSTTVNGNVQVSNLAAATLSITVTNGRLLATGITASSLTLTDTSGSIDFTCSSCTNVTATTTNGSVTGTLTSSLITGSIALTSTNGSINLKLPVAGSFRITANTTLGSVSGSGISLRNHQTTIIGTGTATVTLTTTDGSITVTGT